MTAHLLSIVTILDPERFSAYGSRLIGSTERAGGRYIVRGWTKQVLAGNVIPGERVVLVAYDDPSGPQLYASDAAVVAAKPYRAGAALLRQTVVATSSASVAPVEIAEGVCVVSTISVLEPDAYAAYAAESRAAVARHGGRYLVIGQETARIDGEALEPGNRRLVVAHFPTDIAALAYWNDALYQKARQESAAAADITVRLVGP